MVFRKMARIVLKRGVVVWVSRTDVKNRSGVRPRRTSEPLFSLRYTSGVYRSMSVRLSAASSFESDTL